MRFLKYLVFGLPVLLKSSAANAVTITPPGSAVNWDLWTYGNGSVIQEVLIAISAFTTHSDYLTLILTLATIGVLVMAWITAVTFRPEKLFLYIFGVWVTGYMVIGTTIDINVVDQISDRAIIEAANANPPAANASPVAPNSTVVTDVPAAVGLPAVFISGIGHWLNWSIESSYSLPLANNAAGEIKFPDLLTLSSGASVNMSGGIVKALSQVRFSRGEVKSSMGYYLNDCVMPEIFQGTITSTTLLSSQTLWLDLRSTNLGAQTVTYLQFNNAGPVPVFNTIPGGSILSCADAWTLLNNILPLVAPDLIRATADVWHVADGLAYLQGDPADQVNDPGVIVASLEYLSDGAFNGTAITAVIQAAVINAYKDAYRHAAMVTGNTDLLNALSEQEDEINNGGWSTGAEIFNQLATFIYAVVQCIVLLIAPLMMLGLMIPGYGGKLLGSYAKALIWLALWEPVLGLLNFIVQVFQKQGLLQLWLNSSGNLTMENMTQILNTTDTYISVAGMIASAIPIFIWQLVQTGSGGFSSLLDRSLSSMGQASRGMGRTAGGGMSSGTTALAMSRYSSSGSIGYQSSGSFQAASMVPAGGGMAAGLSSSVASVGGTVGGIAASVGSGVVGGAGGLAAGIVSGSIRGGGSAAMSAGMAGSSSPTGSGGRPGSGQASYSSSIANTVGGSAHNSITGSAGVVSGQSGLSGAGSAGGAGGIGGSGGTGGAGGMGIGGGTYGGFGGASYAHQQLTAKAKKMKPQEFGNYIQSTFGNGIPQSAAQGLQQDLQSGNFKSPAVSVGGSRLGSHAAAYDQSNGNILISDKLMSDALQSESGAAMLDTALTEEYGHHVDNMLRNQYSSVGGDAKGDEGAAFASGIIGSDENARPGLQAMAAAHLNSDAISNDQKSGSLEFFESSGNATESLSSGSSRPGYSSSGAPEPGSFDRLPKKIGKGLRGIGSTGLQGTPAANEPSRKPSVKDLVKIGGRAAGVWGSLFIPGSLSSLHEWSDNEEAGGSGETTHSAYPDNFTINSKNESGESSHYYPRGNTIFDNKGNLTGLVDSDYNVHKVPDVISGSAPSFTPAEGGNLSITQNKVNGGLETFIETDNGSVVGIKNDDGTILANLDKDGLVDNYITDGHGAGLTNKDDIQKIVDKKRHEEFGGSLDQGEWEKQGRPARPGQVAQPGPLTSPSGPNVDTQFPAEMPMQQAPGGTDSGIPGNPSGPKTDTISPAEMMPVAPPVAPTPMGNPGTGDQSSPSIANPNNPASPIQPQSPGSPSSPSQPGSPLRAKPGQPFKPAIKPGKQGKPINVPDTGHPLPIGDPPVTPEEAPFLPQRTTSIPNEGQPFLPEEQPNIIPPPAISPEEPSTETPEEEPGNGYIGDQPGPGIRAEDDTGTSEPTIQNEESSDTPNEDEDSDNTEANTDKKTEVLNSLDAMTRERVQKYADRVNSGLPWQWNDVGLDISSAEQNDIHKLAFEAGMLNESVRTQPSLKPDPNNKPRGQIETAHRKDIAPENIRALELQEEASHLMSQAGYDTKRLPKSNIPGKKNPDYEIEGNIFDHIAFSTPKARNIWKRSLDEKIAVNQADRLVINITDSDVKLSELKEQFLDHPMPGLKEAIVITRDGEILHIWPPK